MNKCDYEEKQRKIFLESFEKEHNDRIENFFMVQLFGRKTIFEELNLKYENENAGLCGLFLLGNRLHFYAPKTETPFFLRQSGFEETDDQYACFSDFAHFSVEKPSQTGFLKHIFKNFELCLNVQVSENSPAYKLAARLNEDSLKIAEFLDKFQK